MNKSLNTDTDENEIVHSNLNGLSYGFGSFSREFLRMAFSAYAFYFYESEVGLDTWLVGFAFILFAVYNMFNDPIIGYLTNKPFKFTRKWGRRFPWILIGGLPWGISYILIFLPPTLNTTSGAWILFIWLLFTTCLFDTFHSLFFVNFQGLFPEKFRTMRERRKVSGYQVMIGVFGIAMGAVLPPLLFTFADVSSYVWQGVVSFIIVLIGFIIAIPGTREDPETINRYLDSMKEKQEKTSFFATMWKVMKQGPFISFMAIYTMYNCLVETMQASIPYVVRYGFGLESGATTLVFAGFLIGVLVSSPFWMKLSYKLNDNKKIMVIAAFLLGCATLPMFFITDYYVIVANMFIWGVPLGGYWIMISPVFSDVIDHSVVITGKREESVYTGIQQFFGRLGIIAQALTFSIIHTLTGFIEGGLTQSPEAVMGIRLHLAVIPTIFIWVGALLFWRFYKLTPEKIVNNRNMLKDMEL